MSKKNRTQAVQNNDLGTLAEPAVTTRSFSLNEVLKSGGRIKVSRDVFYDLYVRNGDIRACIRDIAKRVGVKGVYLEKKNKVWDNGTDVASVFKYPTFLDFKVELFKHLMVGGEVFIVPVFNGFKQVVGFNFLDPRTMKKYINRTTKEIVAYGQISL